MMIEREKCKTVNAEYEVWDDYAKAFTEKNKKEIEKRCAEIMMGYYASKKALENKDTTWGLCGRGQALRNI